MLAPRRALCVASQGVGPYNKKVTQVEKDIKDLNKRIFELVGVKESDTGLAPPAQWDLVSDKQMMQEEQPLQARLPGGSTQDEH